MCCSVLTPYYLEEVLFSKTQLNEENEDGVSVLFYLQKIYPGIFFSKRLGSAYSRSSTFLLNRVGYPSSLENQS